MFGMDKHKILPVFVGALLILLFLAPFFVPKFLVSVLIIANVFAILAMSWDILSGYTGQLSFGHSFFVGLGGYASGMLNIYLHFPIWLSMIAGALMALVGGLIMGIPALRLRGPYFSVVTMVLPIIAFRLVMVYSKYTGGELGVGGVEALSMSQTTNYYYSLIFMVFTAALLLVIAKSRWGLIFQAIREDEDAVVETGKNTAKFKIISFCFSSGLSGLGGAFLVHYLMGISPGAILDLNVTIEIVIAAIVGGMGTIWGPIAGGYFLIISREYLRFLGEWRMFTFAVIALVLMLYSPQGISSLRLKSKRP